MRISFGNKFRPDGLSTEIVAAFPVVMKVAEEAGAETFVFLSGRDREHRTASRHYLGHAVDIWWAPTGTMNAAAAKIISNRLGPCYDVVAEGDHVHVEYDPKTGINK